MQALFALSRIISLAPPGIVALLVAIVPVDAQAEVFDGRYLGDAPQASQDFQRVILDRHNAERRAVGAPAMAWSARLARDAAQYARHLAKTGRFDHADQHRSPKPQGENLWKGTRNAYSFAEMVETWLDERHDFKPGIFPNISRSGDFYGVGHYTTIIWPATTEVGCAFASNAENDYLVCRYNPAGNVMGSTLLATR